MSLYNQGKSFCYIQYCDLQHCFRLGSQASRFLKINAELSVVSAHIEGRFWSQLYSQFSSLPILTIYPLKTSQIYLHISLQVFKWTFSKRFPHQNSTCIPCLPNSICIPPTLMPLHYDVP
jgi:hypothetical protein